MTARQKEDRRSPRTDNAFTVPISARHQWHRGSHFSHFMDGRACCWSSGQGQKQEYEWLRVTRSGKDLSGGHGGGLWELALYSARLTYVYARYADKLGMTSFERDRRREIDYARSKVEKRDRSWDLARLESFTIIKADVFIFICAICFIFQDKKIYFPVNDFR